MILWCDGAHDPAENMRRDVALLERCDREASEGASPEAVLRLFCFRPPGITLGHAQRAERVLDLERCRADGVPWAARPTGGRAIFHAEEWTYSLTAAIADPDWGGRLADAYGRASVLIRDSLMRLGVPAALASRSAHDHAHAPLSSEADSIRGRATIDGVFESCFTATARHEVVLGGRKLVGSAQRRTSRALLQQGSVMLGPGHARLAEYLRIPDQARSRIRAAIEDRSAHAGPFLPHDPPLEMWADALAASLPEDSRRLDAAAGGFLLTLPEAAPYTPPAS